MREKVREREWEREKVREREGEAEAEKDLNDIEGS